MLGDTGNQITIWSVVSLLAGTIISSIVAYVLQRNSFSEAGRARENERRAAREATGYSILFKMIKIASNQSTLRKMLEDSFQRASEEGFQGRPWHIVVPLANYPDKVQFTAEEMALLLSLDFNLFNAIGHTGLHPVPKTPSLV
jgi:hypothetical protein